MFRKYECKRREKGNVFQFHLTHSTVLFNLHSAIKPRYVTVKLSFFNINAMVQMGVIYERSINARLDRYCRRTIDKEQKVKQE